MLSDQNRRTYSTNGLNPRTSCKIYQVYVVPRLLYGLETLDLQYKDLTALQVSF
jgi:hypothetical protein